ncbi:MAG: hypothetical protein Kow0031_27470 [Anaerolineae bacterium]
MLQPIIRQKPELFDTVAQHWRTVTGGKLLLLSDTTAPISSPDEFETLNWPDALAAVSLDAPTTLTVARETLLCAPVQHNGARLGYLLAKDSPATHIPLLQWAAQSLAARVADQLAMRDMTDELIDAWEQLELIFRVTKSLTLTTDLTATLHSILLEIEKVTRSGDGFMVLKQGDTRQCVPGREVPSADLCHTLRLNQIVSAQQVIICNSLSACNQHWLQRPATVENALLAPLQIAEYDIEAVIGLINKSPQPFTAGDAKLVGALAQQVATIIKSHVVHAQLLHKERFSRELEIAAEIQESMLPTDLPHVGGLAMAVSSTPASEVGGDFFDLVTVDDHHLTLVIGDVSGKGIPAAMLTSVTRTMLRVEAVRGEPPHKIIQQANSVLYRDLSRADAFVTVFVATIDTHEGTLTYASAGHTPTLLWCAETRQVEQLRATSLPLGIFDIQQSQSRTVPIHPGDTMVFYTDGITEAQSPNNDLFGLNRLIYIIESRASDSPEQLQQFIRAEVARFRRDAAWRDDATLLVIKTLASVGASLPQHISTVVKMVEFNYPANMDYLRDISQEIVDTCRELSQLPSGSRGDDFIYLIELAISEICTNIVKHAYVESAGDISGRVTLLNNGVQLDFYDQGLGFDPNSVPDPRTDPNELKEGGYGLHIVRQIMDVVSYESSPSLGNHWHLIKFLPSK